MPPTRLPSPAVAMCPSDPAPAPYLRAHQAGTLVWVDLLFVPPAARGAGAGRRLYTAWEAGLPADVSLVRVFAADTGAGPSDGFWEAMGFQYVYDAENPADLDYEAAHMLWKGVNGHPTPPAVRVRPAGDEAGDEAGDDADGGDP